MCAAFFRHSSIVGSVVVATGVLCLAPLAGTRAAGLDFQEAPGWQAVLEQAKAENKYVFVDMTATWCAPCKAMKHFVYPKKAVGDAFNEQFISVRVQTDVTDKDSEQIKRWYEDAAALQKQYNVTAVPTFLFFSPEGKIVHRTTGQKTIEQMVELARDALDPQKQVYTVLERYRQKGAAGVDYSRFPTMVALAKDAGDLALSESLAQQYLNDHIYKKDAASLTAEEVGFIAGNVKNSADRGFSLFSTPATAKVIDRIMERPGYASSVADNIIRAEFITPKLDKTASAPPDWKPFEEAIAKKYGRETAERVVLDAKHTWHWEREDWTNFFRYYFERMERFGADMTTMSRAFINNAVYGWLLPSVDDPVLIGKAADWMKKIVEADAGEELDGSLRADNIDTYANVLYKAGRREEAVAWQKKAVELDEAHTRESGSQPNAEMRATLEKMQRDEPIWN